jgi:outer membrane protein assembly factor BamB
MSRLAAILIFCILSVQGAAASDWPLFGHDASRSGATNDRVLTTSNVAALRVKWRMKLGDVADSAPIVVGSRLFQTSKDGTTYAIDTADGRVLWRFTTSGPNITTSVPAYDEATKSLYVPGVDGYVHLLEPATGRELHEHGFPVQITRAPQTEKNASALNIANGYLYAQTSGYFGDATPYVGHVVAIRLSDGDETVFNTLCAAQHSLIDPATCPQQRSGMWSRAGVVVDPDPSMHGRIYGATGNGPFDVSAGDYGDSILSLSKDAGTLEGSYTPANYAELDAGDLDLGSSSPALLPRQSGSTTPLMTIQGGKDSLLRLLDRTNLGGAGEALQTIDLGARLFCAPAIWRDGSGAVWVFIDIQDGVHAFRLVTSDGKSRLVSAWHADVTSTYEGTSPVVDNGVLFVAGSSSLAALDARSGKTLWQHDSGSLHWESPAIANGVVYCADEDGYLTAYGLP